MVALTDKRKTNKIIQDTVHGYIHIPQDYCKKIIDTPLFQRLRRIEQTSIRSLYPCAHHERFVHSLGTYYIGDKIFESVRNNATDDLDKAISPELWEKLRKTYALACLLHDCGHSPFSHTLERFYEQHNDLNKLLNDSIDHKIDKSFITDNRQWKGSAHEKVSAFLVLTQFNKDIKSEKADPNLIARMIIGCKYLTPGNNYQKIANCFISLLNGGIIDADRLDYSKRDTKASGYTATQIDVERLLSSVSIIIDKEGNYKVCYLKRAIGDIPRILELKDFQTSWVFSHHKTKYDQKLLEQAVERMAEIIAEKSSTPKDSISKKDILGQIFSVKSFTEECPIGKTDCIYLPSDGDIVYLLKKYLPDNKYAKEWLSRQHSLKPLWKSYQEFCALFSGINETYLEENGLLEQEAKVTVQNWLSKKGVDPIVLQLSAENTRTPVEPNQVFVSLGGEIRRYGDLHKDFLKKSKAYFFYLYVPAKILEGKNKSKYKNEIITTLRNLLT